MLKPKQLKSDLPYTTVDVFGCITFEIRKEDILGIYNSLAKTYKFSNVHDFISTYDYRQLTPLECIFNKTIIEKIRKGL
jgi:hypothetical protein